MACPPVQATLPCGGHWRVPAARHHQPGARCRPGGPRGVAWLGFFYGGNIAGAVIGIFSFRKLSEAAAPAALRVFESYFGKEAGLVQTAEAD
jgi:hypothetical protein